MLKKIVLAALVALIAYKYHPEILGLLDGLMARDRAPREAEDVTVEDKDEDSVIDNPMGVKGMLENSRDKRYKDSE